MKILHMTLPLCCSGAALLVARSGRPGTSRADAPGGPVADGAPAAPAAIDFSGMWTGNMQEDSMERGAGPELVDYAGFPINEAGRLWALSYDPSRLTSRFHQCDGYVASVFGSLHRQHPRVGRARSKAAEADCHSLVFADVRRAPRVLDGRTPPSACVCTSYLDGLLDRNLCRQRAARRDDAPQTRLAPPQRIPESDQATLVEFFVRHGDHITYTSVINDPVFLTEPSIKTTDFFRQPIDPGGWLFPCDDSEQVVGRAPDQVPNYLFGKHPYLEEHANKYKCRCWARLADRKPCMANSKRR